MIKLSFMNFIHLPNVVLDSNFKFSNFMNLKIVKFKLISNYDFNYRPILIHFPVYP